MGAAVAAPPRAARGAHPDNAAGQRRGPLQPCRGVPRRGLREGHSVPRRAAGAREDGRGRRCEQRPLSTHRHQVRVLLQCQGSLQQCSMCRYLSSTAPPAVDEAGSPSSAALVALGAALGPTHRGGGTRCAAECGGGGGGACWSCGVSYQGRGRSLSWRWRGWSCKGNFLLKQSRTPRAVHVSRRTGTNRRPSRSQGQGCCHCRWRSRAGCGNSGGASQRPTAETTDRGPKAIGSLPLSACRRQGNAAQDLGAPGLSRSHHTQILT
mmetsp:Transcript_41000/g.129794  ORF Transcript_41000/g.129794 Transcript_41000/m.129794 type:complete len:266 (-) Transcript_41000:98-895(-)